MIYDIVPDHTVVYIFANGKGAQIKMSAYQAKSRRRKISGACSADSPLVGAVYIDEKPKDIFIRSSAGRALIVSSAKIKLMNTRTAGGVQIIKLPKKGVEVDFVTARLEELGEAAKKCKKGDPGSMGSVLSQLSFDF